MRFQGISKLFVAAVFARSTFFTQRVDARKPNKWQTLNSTVGGRLRASMPFARPCFTLASVDVGSSNPIECMSITENYLNHCKCLRECAAWDAQSKELLVTRSETFGTYMNVLSSYLLIHAYLNRIPQTQWETCQQRSTQCLLDDTLPNNTAAYHLPWSCAQGSIPNYYVSHPTLALA